MAERAGEIKIRSLQRQWKWQSILLCLLLSLSVSLLLIAILHVWAQWPLWVGIILLVAGLVAALLLFPYWRVTSHDIARHLDSQAPALEESCGLVFRPVEALGPLERLQAERTEARLASIHPPYPFRRKLLLSGCLLPAACMISAWIGLAGGKGYLSKSIAAPEQGATKAEQGATNAEQSAPGIRSVNVRIIPPAYTGRPIRQQQDLNLQVEEGAIVSWQLETGTAIGTLQLIFNDSIRVSLKRADGAGPTGLLRWQYTAPVLHRGFYQIGVQGRLSALYKLEVIKDEAPRIQVRSPKPYTIVDNGDSRKIPLSVRVLDDYGVTAVAVMATVASGSGEAVKFKEQALSFNQSFSGVQPSYDLERTLDLDALSLHPGDELYFYIRAKDNHGQESRSDMYIVSLPDTAHLMSLAGMTTGVNIKPEYFRSERQIILETEQLLREKDTTSLQSMHDRSNDLGVDQKLLRLRYGKFLGEEAEDPTYFGPAIREQLKATLAEMWNAELRLRTFRPLEALPYEYKALRLLKDLQQRSRTYVAKTGVRITAPDPAKRLSGKLGEIVPPVQYNAKADTPPATGVLRIAAAILDITPQTGNGRLPRIGRPSLNILQQAERLLEREAAARPGEFVDACQAMQRILQAEAGTGLNGEPAGSRGLPASKGSSVYTGSRNQAAQDRKIVQQAIRKLLPAVEVAPVAGKAPADDGLSKLYYRSLNQPASGQ